MDILTSLKRAIKNKEKIVMEEGKDYLLFTNSGIKIPRKYPTRIQLKKGGELVTIESLYTYYLYKDKEHKLYNQVVAKEHLTLISVIDKKNILGLLEGTLNEYKFVSSEEFERITREAEPGTYVLSLAQTDASADTSASMPATAATTGGTATSTTTPTTTLSAAAATTTASADISSMASAASVPGVSAAVGGAAGARVSIEDAMGREVPLLKRKHFMCCSSADYSGISAKATKALSGINTKHAAKTLSLVKRDLQMPIIIIPDILSYPLSVTNVKDFLENGVWKRATRKDPKVTSEMVTLAPPPAGSKRKLSGKFKVVDSVNTLEKDDWKRVVAAFVHGQLWQFKDWEWKTHIDVTHNVQTFAISVDKSPLKPTINQWKIPILNVKIIIIING